WWRHPHTGRRGRATRTPKKSGVLGVLGVPESLGASNGAAFRHGTQLHIRRNTRCSEHQWCSAARDANRNTTPAPQEGQQEKERRHVAQAERPGRLVSLVPVTLDGRQAKAQLGSYL